MLLQTTGEWPASCISLPVEISIFPSTRFLCGTLLIIIVLWACSPSYYPLCSLWHSPVDAGNHCTQQWLYQFDLRPA